MRSATDCILIGVADCKFMSPPSESLFPLASHGCGGDGDISISIFSFFNAIELLLNLDLLKLTTFRCYIESVGDKSSWLASVQISCFGDCFSKARV